MRAEADAIVYEATDDHGRLATFGLEALPGATPTRPRILTHCNTGPLACGQFGTALGVVQAASTRGRAVHVWVDETRPYLQGARLTAWELAQAGVPHTLVPDVAAASLMAAGRGRRHPRRGGPDRRQRRHGEQDRDVHAGRPRGPPRHPVLRLRADRAPSTRRRPTERAIPIEERAADEVLLIRGVRIAPAGTAVRNPSFDVTPAELITGDRRPRRASSAAAVRTEGLPAAVAAARRPPGRVSPGADGPSRVAPDDRPTTDARRGRR